MITLLLVMFVVLYSTANTDLEKFKALAESLSEGFGATAPASGMGGGPSIGTHAGTSPVFDTSGGGRSPIALFPEHQVPIDIFQFSEMVGVGSQEGGLMRQLEALVAEASEQAELAGELEGLSAQIQAEFNERGIVISIYPDQILFDSGSARIKPGFRAILEALSGQLGRLPNTIEVQGHTDNVPINTVAYPSNWELSAGRAGSVIRAFQEMGLPPGQLAAAGYADTRPVDTNETRQGRAHNRRVEIVILRGTGEQAPQEETRPSPPATDNISEGQDVLVDSPAETPVPPDENLPEQDENGASIAAVSSGED
jgi:chemotaxis protein MotB